MPMSASTDIVHIATTDHRIPRFPGAQVAEPAAPREATESPLILSNGDSLGPEPLESLGRELAIALTAEWQGLPDTPQVKQMGSLALDLLDRSLANQPDDLIALRSKAQALALSGRRREAMQLDESVLKSAPSYELALDDVVSYAIALGDAQAALAPARQAVAANPGSAAFRERLAYVDLQRDDWSGALREAREALRLDPFLRFARMFVIQCLLHQEELKHAEDEFLALIKLNPSQRESLERWFAGKRRSHGR
jgi:tetratricopeptide (TPR) repeat protein